MTEFRAADRLAVGALALAGIAAAIGLTVEAYRDVPAMVDQAHAADLATLLLAVPSLAIGLWLVHRASPAIVARARLVVAGSLGYLVYTYSIFAFQTVVSPVTPVHIAILGLAAWSLLLQRSVLLSGTAGTGSGLPRRTTAGFLALVTLLFAGLWLGQIASAIVTGELPAAVTDLALPTSAVYALDLAFALPLLAAAAVLLVRRQEIGYPLALAGLVFAVQMAVSVDAIFAIQAAHGDLADLSVPAVFTVIALVAAGLAALGLLPGRVARQAVLGGAA
jgi:hypothetical protein